METKTLLEKITKEVNFRKEVFLKREELLKKSNSKTETLTIDLEDSVYKDLEELAKKESVSVEDYMKDILYQMVLNTYEKPEGINKTIDTAYLLTNMEEVFDSNEDYLLIDTVDINKKVVLICDKEKVNFIQNNKQKE